MTDADVSADIALWTRWNTGSVVLDPDYPDSTEAHAALERIFAAALRGEQVEISDITGELYAVADDHEADVLDSLRRRAGMVWDCLGCRWCNVASDDTCEQCGAVREQETKQ